MWIRRAFVNNLVKVEEACRGYAFFAESLEAIEGRGGEEPCCAEGDGSWCCGYFGG